MQQKLIPITIFTGFLGSGKTTLLNQILKNPKLQDTAVIINEYGEVGVDHLLVEKIASEVIEISSGCVCCTVRGDLVLALENLGLESKKELNQKFKRIIIETTGLADPSFVVRAIMQHPKLASVFRVKNIVVCVDLTNGTQVLASNSEASNQIALADQIILTKSNLLDTSLKQGLVDHTLVENLKKLNPIAEISDCSSPNFKVDTLICARDSDDKKSLIKNTSSVDQSITSNSIASHHESCVKTFTINTKNTVTINVLEEFIDVLGTTVGANILRMKGLIGIKENPNQPAVVQGVQHYIHPIECLEQWPTENKHSFLVFITTGQIEETVRKTFNAFFDIPTIDSPDRRAITDNPLAIAGFS